MTHDAVDGQQLNEIQNILDSNDGSANYLGTALHAVFKSLVSFTENRMEFAKTLSNRDINILNGNNSLKMAAIICAYEHCNVNLLEFLIQHISGNDFDILGDQLKERHSDFLKEPKFFEKGKSKVDEYVTDLAIMVRKKEIFYKRFLIFFNALIRAKNMDRLDFENLLIVANSDISKVSLYAAAYQSDFMIVKFLLNSGLNVSDETVFGREVPFSVLHVAFNYSNCDENVDSLLKTVNVLILYGANVSKKNKCGRSPFVHSVMVKLSNYEVIGSFLALRNLSCNSLNDNGANYYLKLLQHCCYIEIEKLKRHKLYENYSLYFVLLKDVSALKRSLENNCLLFHGLNARELSKTYKFFGSLIASKIKLASEMYKCSLSARPFLDEMHRSFARLLQVKQLPEVVLTRIEDFFSTKDLYLLREKKIKPQLCCEYHVDNTCITHAKF